MIEMKLETSATAELIDACDSLHEILRPLDPRIEVSALITMMCRRAVLYGLDKDLVLEAIDHGYDAFKLAMSKDGPMQ